MFPPPPSSEGDRSFPPSDPPHLSRRSPIAGSARRSCECRVDGPRKQVAAHAPRIALRHRSQQRRGHRVHHVRRPRALTDPPAARLGAAAASIPLLPVRGGRAAVGSTPATGRHPARVQHLRQHLQRWVAIGRPHGPRGEHAVCGPGHGHSACPGGRGHYSVPRAGQTLILCPRKRGRQNRRVAGERRGRGPRGPVRGRGATRSLQRRVGPLRVS